MDQAASPKILRHRRDDFSNQKKPLEAGEDRWKLAIKVDQALLYLRHFFISPTLELMWPGVSSCAYPLGAGILAPEAAVKATAALGSPR